MTISPPLSVNPCGRCHRVPIHYTIDQVNMRTRNKEKEKVHTDDYIMKRRDDEPKQSEKQPKVDTKKKKVLNDEEKQPKKKRKVLNEAEKLLQLKMNYMGRASCRCTVKYVNEILTLFKEPGKMEAYEEIRNTPFGFLLVSKTIKRTQFGPLLGHYLWQRHTGDLTFNIEGNMIKCSIEDWALITGLICVPSGSVVPPYHAVGESYLQNLVKGDGHDNLMDAIRSCENNHDAVKLAVVLILVSYFMGSNKSNDIPLKMFKLAEDLEKFFAYPWGNVTYEKMVTSLNLRVLSRDKDKIPKAYNLYGCCYALQAWFFEICPVVSQSYGLREDIPQRPRLLNWYEIFPPKYQDLVNLIRSEKENLFVEISPTPEEEDEEYWAIVKGRKVIPESAARQLSIQHVPQQSPPHTTPQCEPSYTTELEGRVAELEEECRALRRELVEERKKTDERLKFVEDYIKMLVKKDEKEGKEGSDINKENDGDVRNNENDGGEINDAEIKDEEGKEEGDEETKDDEIKDEEGKEEGDEEGKDDEINDEKKEGGYYDNKSVENDDKEIIEIFETPKKNYVREPRECKRGPHMRTPFTTLPSSNDHYVQAQNKNRPHREVEALKPNDLMDPETPPTSPKFCEQLQDNERAALIEFMNGSTKRFEETKHIKCLSITPTSISDLYTEQKRVSNFDIDAFFELLRNYLKFRKFDKLEFVNSFNWTWMLGDADSYFTWEQTQVGDTKSKVKNFKWHNSLMKFLIFTDGPCSPPFWDKHTVMLPALQDGHWFLVLFFVNRRQIGVLDSLYPDPIITHREQLEKICYILPRLLYFYGCDDALDGAPWTLDKPTLTTPMQKNGNDCGVFVMAMGYYFVHNRTFDFTQSDILGFRRRFAYQLMNGKIHPNMP